MHTCPCTLLAIRILPEKNNLEKIQTFLAASLSLSAHLHQYYHPLPIVNIKVALMLASSKCIMY